MNNTNTALHALQEEYETFMNAPDTRDDKPRVAAWGLVKAGKSSLLNMLSGHVTDEYFATGAIRTTRTNLELETEQYVLIDTPGLDAGDEDTQEAYRGLDSADVILFVHAPQGELDREEIGFLDQVVAEYGTETDQRLIMILTQLDKNQGQNIDMIKDRILDQVEECAGITPKCFLLSNTRYQKGATEHKNTLVEKSGIPALAQHLKGLAYEIQPKLDFVRTQRLSAKKHSLLQRLDNAIESEMALILEIQHSYEKKTSRFNDIIQNLRDEYQSTEKEITSAKRKLTKL
ncbi:GTPase [Castellaniella sp.]|uniref:GTPase n=1 Tax=Castellaniella sp. TaxID=1955812 RepID=UPI002AFF2AD5|nr:GTPase [Castellaniella sp.]